jgi:DNA (cytosine-5)-methyltransferase 1
VKALKALSLFSGIGGIDLACEWAGIETVAFCEREPFPQKVLRKHWPNVPIYDDVCTLTKERLDADGIGTIYIIHGGYPCQGESNAGQRRGADDDRWLWPETARLLEEISPDWFVGENVNGHVTVGLDTVLDDLGHIGYTAQPFFIPALAVDGDHERYRVFIVAYTDKESGLQTHKKISAIRKEWETWKNAGGSGWRPVPRTDWSVSRPPVSRDSDGIPDRVDRCYALGNAVNPYQIYPILKYIKQIDDMLRTG